MFRLPVSGFPVIVHQPTGVEDLLLLEAPALDARFAMMLLDRLVRTHDDVAVDWARLTVTDFEALLLLLRRASLGDIVRAETNCGATGCGARMDVSFRIEEYMASHSPRIPRGVDTSEGDGWLRVTGQGVRFRLPSAADLMAVDSETRPDRELLRRCVEPATVAAHMRRRIESAMETLAPRFSRTLSGECPECHARMDFYFDVQEFVLGELRAQVSSIYQEVHLLALYYKWPEVTILSLPRNRRIHYANALRSQGSAV
jgi:hypothetical protein